ncbi:MAG: hypothetical protein WD768_11795 [Phycisphaeraceae bacterium]
MSTTTIRTKRGFLHWLHELDRILRGETTSLAAMRKGVLELPVAGLIIVLLALAGIYGFCMAWFGLFNRPGAAGVLQLFANMVKVPALFLLTLVVTFPSLYVFNALVGSRLTLRSLTRLLVAAMAVLLAVLASFGPIVAFFSVTTTSHPFILLLNVLFCGIAGFLGMAFLLQTLQRMTLTVAEPVESIELEAVDAKPQAAEGDEGQAALGAEATVVDALTQDAMTQDQEVAQAISEPQGALDPIKGRVLDEHVRTVFRCWVIAFAVVGSQMSWVLRPFIGKPGQEFELFSERGSSFFEAVWTAFKSLLGG